MVHIHISLSGSVIDLDFPCDIIAEFFSCGLDHIDEYNLTFDQDYLSILEYIRDTLIKEPKKESV